MTRPARIVPVSLAQYGPWALIAGGSEGIGAGIAAQLAACGFNLVLVARKSGPLAALAADLRAEYDIALRTLALDLTGEDMLAALRAATDDLEIGLLVYNAGASHRTGAFLDWRIEDAIKVIRLNTEGPARLAHHFGQKMAARGRGGIVIMGSLAGNAGSPSVVPYSGAKAFSQIFAEGLWWEMKRHGVDVLHVIVNSTDTPAMARLGIVFPPGQADDAEEVARFTLTQLGNGPVVPVPSVAARFAALCTTDRRRATEAIGASVMGNTAGTWVKPADPGAPLLDQAGALRPQPP